MCRGRYRLDEAPRPAAHGASSRPVTPDPTKACLDVSSIGRVTLSDGECRWSFPDRASRSGTGTRPPGRPVAAQTAHPAARRERGAGRSPGRRRSCDLARWVARATPSHLAAAALAVVSNSSALQPGRASRAATLISRSGMAQWSSQVNWTMIMSSRGWHALHGLAELPATLGTGIRRVGGVRARQFRLQARRSRRTGRSPACPRFCSPFCSPDGPFRRYSLWLGPAAQG
jgi:hypothetical protein